MLQACIKITHEEINSAFDTKAQTVGYGALQKLQATAEAILLRDRFFHSSWFIQEHILGFIHLTRDSRSPPGNKLILHVNLILLTSEIKLDQIFEDVDHTPIVLCYWATPEVHFRLCMGQRQCLQEFCLSLDLPKMCYFLICYLDGSCCIKPLCILLISLNLVFHHSVLSSAVLGAARLSRRSLVISCRGCS